MVIPAQLAHRVRSAKAGYLSGLLAAGMVALTMATPAHANDVPEAQLVHCGADTCLRIHGHRPAAAVEVRIGGHALAVEGGRDWRVTMPLTTARAWFTASGEILPLTLFDARHQSEKTVDLILPPGALGRRVELASLVIRAR